MDSTVTSIDPSSSTISDTHTTATNLIFTTSSTQSNNPSSPTALIQSNPADVIVPCARRRQKRLRWITEGDGHPNVLRRDVEASEPLKGSYRDHSRRSSEDKHSVSSSGHHGSIPRSKSSPYSNSNPKSQQQPLAPVMEDVAMSSSSHDNSYFPVHGPPPTSSTARLNPTSQIRTPRFPSFERLTSAFRSSIYSSPSTRTSRTKSSAASSAPSRSRSRNASRRGRREEPKQLSIDALISPMSLHQGVGLGRDNDPMDSMQIKHVRGAMINDARYETAPMLRAMSAQNNFSNAPPLFPSPTKPTNPGQNGPAGPTMRAPTPIHEHHLPLRRDNSMTSRDPGSVLTMQPTTSRFYQSQLPPPQPQLSREPSTRQPQPLPYPDPVRPSPTVRRPEKAHHPSRSSSDGSKHKHRRERERPPELVQSSTLLPTSAIDLGKPFQVVYPVGNLDGGTGRHHRRGSTSNNLDRQGSHRRTRSRSRSTSRTHSASNNNTLVGAGHSHSRSLSNSGTATLARSHSDSRGDTPTGTGNGSGGTKLRRSAERKRPRGERPKIPSYEVNGHPPIGYGPGHEFNGNWNGNGHYMSV
ncbi:hypothetical protein BJ322DRAFT_890760 [Thelephora terrestris]|uniref:Uncharacterized protein n=1 Tax=Thelephora terrestris TaxID=56493 RepID=A0A9P6L5W6_9AGAM|nr:hypothetical protein BJ322DRAFT_890760 [Thelephora terrestris]